MTDNNVEPRRETMTEVINRHAGAELLTASPDQIATFDMALRYGELMAKGGGMVPAHCQGNAAVSTMIALVAISLGLSPVQVAQETYQARQGGPVGYQAKMWNSALLKHGVKLNFTYEGTIQRLEEPAKSAKGNITAPSKAIGDRRCTAYIVIDGERYEYTTPTLDEIKIKNSPLWHNDPDMQLAYYAARSWARKHRPDVMLGLSTTEEVREEARTVKDITPKEDGFAARVNEARALAKEEIAEGDVSADLLAKAELAKAASEGWAAFFEDKGQNENPYSAEDQPEKFAEWKLGWSNALDSVTVAEDIEGQGEAKAETEGA